MISSRGGAPGRLGALYSRLPASQLGIGYYESVGAATPAVPAQPVPGNSQPITLVSAPAPADDNVQALTQEQKAATSALAVMGMFGAACLAAWAGYSLTQSLRRQTA